MGRLEGDKRPAQDGMSSPTGQFTKMKVLRRGANAAVYCVGETADGQRLLIKLLKRSQVGGSDTTEAEVFHSLRLRHPHILPPQELLLTGDHLVMVMGEGAGGTLLSDLVTRGQGLPEAEARWFFLQILFCLEYIHRMGVALRCVTLDSFLVDDICSGRPVVKLVECGLSCRSEGVQPHAEVLPSRQYISPELLESLRGVPYDAQAADVWQAGVLLYSLLTGNFPFHRPDEHTVRRHERWGALMRRIRAADYAVPEWLPADCRELLASMLVADPSQRPSARDLLHHPWVRASGMDPEGLLRCNDAMVEHAAAHPLPPEVAREVQAILQEAVRKPPTPHTTVQVQCSAAVPLGGGAQAPMPPHACPTRSWKRLFGGLFRKRAGA